MIVDTSVWVAGLLEQDVHHEAGLACMGRFISERQPVTVPVLVWAEIAGAIARRSGDAEKALEVTRFIAAQEWLTSQALDAALAEESARHAARLRLRGADAVYVALAARRRVPLLTLDVEMLARGQGLVQVLTPEQWLAAP